MHVVQDNWQALIYQNDITDSTQSDHEIIKYLITSWSDTYSNVWIDLSSK